MSHQILVNEVVLGTAFGIFVGPYFANVFDPRAGKHTDDITLEVMRIVLAIGLFAIGVELPKSYLWQHSKSLLAMVVPTMAIGWVIVAGTSLLLQMLYMLTSNILGLINFLFPALNWISCLVVSACLTPTDPIICAAIVGKIKYLPFSSISDIDLRATGGKFAQKHVPIELRHLLSAESAANDGLAYPFLTLAIYLTIDETTKTAITRWVLIGCLCMYHYKPFMYTLQLLTLTPRPGYSWSSHGRGFGYDEYLCPQHPSHPLFHRVDIPPSYEILTWARLY